MSHRSAQRARSFCFIAIALLTLPAAAAQAAQINVFSSQNVVTVGGTISVFFEIGGLSSALDDSLSGFDFDVRFDPTLLSLSGSSFVDPLTLLNQLDLPEAGSLGFVNDQNLAGGVLDILALSGNSSSLLDQGQADAFRFLTLTFTALAPGALTTVSLDLMDPGLAFLDSSAGLLAPTFLQSSASIAIRAPGAQVPEPTSIVLLIAGAALLACARRARISPRT